MEDTRRLAVAVGVAAVAGCLTGCSLFVMAGKMMLGDPKMPSAFRQATRIDLAKESRKVLVVCSIPEAVRGELPSLDFDLLDGVTRRLKLRGIGIVNPNDVATWKDDNGGVWHDPSELAEQFDADYIIHIDLERFTYREDNSRSLLRGRASGNVVAYQVRTVNGRDVARHVFEREFSSEYPQLHPISADSVSDRNFRKQYLDRVSSELAQMFYDHRLSEGM